MNSKELSKKLHEMYFNAPKGELVSMIHLFGIKYAEDLMERNISIKEIVKDSGISSAYQTEISKGIKLAKYVTVKPNY
ncbi:hypothetical protein ACIGCP_11480 [Cellulophaga baltica]|uniref:HTH-like domain-containing protein n=1 Tax=Cellulophaga baltica TaxID=76594 RepID=UPI0037C9F6BB